MGVGWVALASVGGLAPVETPEVPALALAAAGVEFFGDVEPRRWPASLLAADALRSSSTREFGRARMYALAIWLSLHRTPREALSIALWAMPLGEDCQGLDDAALRYMHQPLRQLDASQVVALIAIARSASGIERDPELWRERRDRLLLRLQGAGAITDPELQAALARPVLPAGWQVRPR